MADLSIAEIEALRRANQKAEVEQCRAMLARDREHVRAAFWNRIPERVRVMTCHMAGLPAAKGKGALKQMDAAERAKVHAEARRLIRDLETLLRCAQGGVTHDHGEMAPHLFDGIAAAGVQ